jgi:integrase
LSRSQIYILKFDQVDFENQILAINRHIDWPRRKDSKLLVVEGSKAGPSRFLPLPPDVKELFLRRKNLMPQSSLVFCDKSQQVYPYRMIQCRYDQAFKEAGIIDKRGAHALRHTFAVDFLNQTGNVLALQKLLGHSNLKETMIYGKYDMRSALSASDAYQAKSMDLGTSAKEKLHAI